MAVLAVQSIDASGLTPAFTPASSGGDEMPLAEHNVLWVKNGGASPVTVTLNTIKPSNYGDTTDFTFTVNPGSEKLVRPGTIPGGVERFRNASGRAEISYSATASVTVAVIGA